MKPEDTGPMKPICRAPHPSPIPFDPEIEIPLFRPYPKPWFDPEIDIGYRPHEGD